MNYLKQQNQNADRYFNSETTEHRTVVSAETLWTHTPIGNVNFVR